MKYFCVLIILFSTSAFAEGRFLYDGDGSFSILSNKTGKKFSGPYRNSDGTYNEEALLKINEVFDVTKDFGENVSLRTLAFIDYLEDKFAKNKTLTLNSGFRSPEYNQQLREKGALAGKTSYHMEAMAADLIFPGVKSKDIWEFARGLNYGGLGFYDGKSVHVDSGKPRSWTAETAIDPNEGPPLNKNIYLSVDKDVYYFGESLRMFFSAVSNFPYGVKNNMKIVDVQGNVWKIFPTWNSPAQEDECIVIQNRAMSRRMDWQISQQPESLKQIPQNQALNIKVEFCDPVYENMPSEVMSREFKILPSP